MKAALKGISGFIAAFIFGHSAHAADANPIIPPVSTQETTALLSGAALPSGLPPALNTEQWKRYSNQVRANWTQYVTKIAKISVQ